MKRSHFLFPLSAFVVFASFGAEGKLDWSLPSGARIEGDRLIAEIPAEEGPRNIWCAATLDVGEALAAMQCVAAHVRFRAENVSEPKEAWQGVKVQFMFDPPSGAGRIYRSVNTARGTYGWTNVTVRVSPLRDASVKDGVATLILGLEGCTGRAEFDLASLRIEYEDVGIPRVNEDWVVRYPHDKGLSTNPQILNCSQITNDNSGALGDRAMSDEADPQAARNFDLPFVNNGVQLSFVNITAQRRPPLRGCMLPQRATTEDDIETLHRWGATLARFQITRDFGKVDANSDLAEYAAWVDSRLDNLAEVLGWAQARGMKVCVDLHATPGGVRAGDRATAMLYDERLAGAFVETWRHIATRCAPAVQTACAPAVQTAGLYGYDLVNEPKQIAFAPISYWDIQRRAAEAIREIDPDTPIIVESNDSASAGAFRYLSPLAMDNVIYQLHMYAPGDFTHQGVGRPLEKDGRPLVWPDSARGWDIDWLRRALAPVREFQTRHRCRIYVGEFSAAAWAPGADQYLRDCIGIFEEYGWDWTYHAFREWPPWSVEHEVPGPGKPSVPSADNPRKQVLLEGFRQQPTAIDYNRQQSTAFDSLR